MAWTTISNALVAVGAKPFATTMQALRDNPVAIADGDAGAPVNSPGWHPFDMVSVGDGATGRVYNSATDGAVASVTVNFVDGYDYFVRWVSLTGSTGVQNFRIAGVNISGTTSFNAMTGTMEITAPRLADLPKWAMVHLRTASGSAGPAAFTSSSATPYYGLFNFTNLATALSSVAFAYSSGNINGGQIFLYRRRNFMFG
jgi:hypothetical protein